MYGRKNAQNKHLCDQRTGELEIQIGQSVAHHLSDFQDLVNHLGNMKSHLDDKLQALLLLSSLQNNSETLVVSLSNFASNGVVTLQMIKDNMHNQETGCKDMGMDDTSSSCRKQR